MASDDELSKRERDTLARMDAAFEAVDALLFRLGQQGLQRMTRSSLAELQALAQTAHNAKLADIKRELELLSTAVERYLDRDPLFRMDGYMSCINRLWLLVEAARRARQPGLAPTEMVDVIGEARRSYVLLDEPLEVQPIGASGWVTDTDFVGITVYFQGIDGEVYQASNAKPSMYFGTDPRRLMNQDISDYQSISISKLAHGAYRFVNAKVSRDKRLSLHKDLVIEKAPWRGAAAYRAYAATSWTVLVDRLREAEVHPVRSGETTYAYVEPSGFGEFVLDQKRQVATCPVLDGSGAEMVLEVALRDENNFLIDNIERFLGKAAEARASDDESEAAKKPSGRAASLQPDGLFGRVWVADGALKIFPYTALYHEPMRLQSGAEQHEVHLSLETLLGAKHA